MPVTAMAPVLGAGLAEAAGAGALGASAMNSTNNKTSKSQVMGDDSIISTEGLRNSKSNGRLSNIFLSAIDLAKKAARPGSSEMDFLKKVVTLSTTGNNQRPDDDDDDEKKRKEKQLKKDAEKFNETDAKAQQKRVAQKGQERWGESIDVDKSQTPKANAKEASRLKTSQRNPNKFSSKNEIMSKSNLDKANDVVQRNHQRYLAEKNYVEHAERIRKALKSSGLPNEDIEGLVDMFIQNHMVQ